MVKVLNIQNNFKRLEIIIQQFQMLHALYDMRSMTISESAFEVQKCL